MNGPELAVWGRVADHVKGLRTNRVLDDDEVRLKHLRYLVVQVGTAISRGDPLERDQLETLAAAAIHWALLIPDERHDDD